MTDPKALAAKLSREELGKLVRRTFSEFYVYWKNMGNPVKDSCFVSWDKLQEHEREVDRVIGWAVAKFALEASDDKAKVLKAQVESLPTIWSQISDGNIPYSGRFIRKDQVLKLITEAESK